MVAMFALTSLHFSHWWITLFSFVPLVLFENHTLIIDADIEAAQGGDEDIPTE